MSNIYSEKFRLRTSDYDKYDHLTPKAILDLFQDVAGKHADYIGVGFDDMIKRDLIWVLVRTKYEVIRYPKLYSTVIVTTWPKKKGRLDFDREYEILDENGDLLIKGISKWVIINVKTRRVSAARDINYSCDIIDKENFTDSFPKIEDFEIDSAEKYTTYTSFSDLDHNGHVNNINYAKYIVDALKFKEDEIIQKFEINYLKELPFDSKIDLFSKKENSTILCKGKKEEDISFISKVILF